MNLQSARVCVVLSLFPIYCCRQIGNLLFFLKTVRHNQTADNEAGFKKLAAFATIACLTNSFPVIMKAFLPTQVSMSSTGKLPSHFEL